MLNLPENRRMGKVSITPKNWKTGKKPSLNKMWLIRYRYYDDNKGISKQVSISNFNRVNSLEERRRLLQDSLDFEIDNLQNNGWDPILGECIPSLKKEVVVNEVSKYMPFESALKFADTKIKVSEDTRKQETNNILKQILEQASKLGIAQIAMNEVTRRNLREIIEKCAIKKDTKVFSGDKYNRCRKVLGYYYKELLDFDVVDANIPLSLNRQKLDPKRVEAEISPKDQKKLSNYLRDNFRSYWLYLQVFYNIAPRSTEMMRLQVKHVDFANQNILFSIHKGKRYIEKNRVMTDLSVKYWKEIIGDAPKDWFVFSEGLKPGLIPIKSYQIHKRWYRLVTQNEQFKDIDITFYQLKHLRLTDVADSHGIEQASKLAAENEKTVRKHYDMNPERSDDKLKKSGKEF